MSSTRRPLRALLVTSSYSPTVIADIHRIRHLAWELPLLGWEVEVIAPGPSFQRPEYFESDSEHLFNPETKVHTVGVDDAWLFEALNMRSIGWRTLKPLRDAGNRLLEKCRFDVVYISTANFNLFCLGVGWSRKFKVPFVLDFHDPWVREKVDYRTTTNRWKRFLAACIARPMERYAVRGAAGIVSVSPFYLQELRRRHPSAIGLTEFRSVAMPFAGSERDVSATSGDLRSAVSGRMEIMYVGAGGSIMSKSFTHICVALAAARGLCPALLQNVTLKLCGTHTLWKAGDRKHLLEVATHHGLGDIVDESPARISYTEAMKRSQQSDGIVILGVDDAGYMPSKLFTSALTGRPLLASFRSDSAMSEYFEKMPALGQAIIYDSTTGRPSGDPVAAVLRFLKEVAESRWLDRRQLVSDYLAPAMAKRHVSLFEHIIGSANHSV